MANIAEQLHDAAKRGGWLDRPALLDGAASWSHRDVHCCGARLAAVLAGRGIRRGNRVLIALPDSAALVALFLGVGRLGAMSVLVNPQLPALDYRRLVEQVRPHLVITEPELAMSFTGVRWASRSALVATAAKADELPAVETAGDTPLYVQFTSGTTGAPRGVVHAHRDIAAYHDAVGVDMLGLGPSDVSLSISKMFFAYGFGNSLVYPLCSGSSAVLIRARPTPETVAELVERHGVTVLHAVPTAYANLLAETGAEPYRTIRVAVSAGESLPVTLGQRASELLGAPVLDELGSTEVGGAYCANRLPDNAPGTIGRPLRGYEVQIRDDSGAPIPDGTSGQLWVRGPTIFSEYLNPADRRAMVVQSGWLRTNDIAHRRPGGRYVYIGRSDDMEIVGGINVSPHEVEAVLREHPGVREVAVAAIPDERGASKLRAFVVPVGHADPHTLAQELTDLARAELAAFKVPRSVELVERLPRTVTGKVQRFVVRQGAW